MFLEKFKFFLPFSQITLKSYNTLNKHLLIRNYWLLIKLLGNLQETSAISMSVETFGTYLSFRTLCSGLSPLSSKTRIGFWVVASVLFKELLELVLEPGLILSEPSLTILLAVCNSLVNSCI
jgi:hypothetical protein